MKIIKLIIGVIFLFNSTAYSYQGMTKALRSQLMSGDEKEARRLKDAAAQLILDEMPEQDISRAGFTADAYTAAKAGNYDQAYDLIMKALAGENHDDLTAYIYSLPGNFLFRDTNDPVRKCLKAGCSRIIATQFGGKSVYIFEIDIKATLTRGVQGALADLLSEEESKSFVFHRDDYKVVDGNKYARYSLEFTYLGKKREIVIYYRMDATKVIPPEIKQGYDILYVARDDSRDKAGRKISDMMKLDLTKLLLRHNSGLIIMDGSRYEDLLQYEEPVFLNSTIEYFHQVMPSDAAKNFNIYSNIDKTINADYSVNTEPVGVVLKALIIHYGLDTEKGGRLDALMNVIVKYNNASNQAGLYEALKYALIDLALSEELETTASALTGLGNIKREDLQDSL